MNICECRLGITILPIKWVLTISTSVEKFDIDGEQGIPKFTQKLRVEVRHCLICIFSLTSLWQLSLSDKSADCSS